MQDLLGLGDTKKLKAAAGLAGGIGHRGADCGILTAGTLALGIAAATEEGDQEMVEARGCMYANEYVRQFRQETGCALCHEIIQTDFDSNWELRKYILSKSLKCVKMSSKVAPILVDIVTKPIASPDDLFYDLNRRFSAHDFNCAHSTLTWASELMELPPVFPPHMLIPLNGGIGYSGNTCAALMGGCVAIGIVKGGDTSQAGMLSTFRRMALTLIRGKAAFNDLKLSPANDALLRCADLADWFRDRFQSIICRDITGVDFTDEGQARQYFDEDGVAKCMDIGKETAQKAAELTR